MLFTYSAVLTLCITLLLQSGAKRESQLVWADIDKDLLLPYSYSGERKTLPSTHLSASFSLHDKTLLTSLAKRWSVIVRSVPTHLSFPKKLEKLYDMFSASGEEKTASSSSCNSISSSKRKRRNCNVSDDDSDSMSDGSADKCEEVSKTQHTKKREKMDSSKGAKKTPLGNILSSLLRKKEGFPPDAEANYNQGSHLERDSSISCSAPCQANSETEDARLAAGLGDPQKAADCEATCSALTEGDKDKAAASVSASGNLNDPTCLTMATGDRWMSGSISSERRGNLDYIEKKKRKLIRIQKRLKKISRAQARERKNIGS